MIKNNQKLKKSFFKNILEKYFVLSIFLIIFNDKYIKNILKYIENIQKYQYKYISIYIYIYIDIYTYLYQKHIKKYSFS